MFIEKVNNHKPGSFIHTNNDDWFIVAQSNIPDVNKCIPIIACIGTSRDGKSTLLNLYCEWLLKDKNTIKPYEPFIIGQSDDMITNGIDFYEIPDECILLDCQGMQLENAKHDHYINLITYLISDIIILTVR